MCANEVESGRVREVGARVNHSGEITSYISFSMGKTKIKHSFQARNKHDLVFYLIDKRIQGAESPRVEGVSYIVGHDME